MQSAPARTLAPYRAASGRARAARIGLATVGLLAVVAGIHYFSAFDLIRRAELLTAAASEGDAFEQRRDLILGFITVGTLLTGVAWFLWLHRAVANAWALGRPIQYTPGWAVGWWFVPLANLIQPYRIVRALADEVEAPRANLVKAWWGCYIATILVNNFGSLLTPEDFDAFRVAYGSLGLAEALRATSALLAFMIVGDIEPRSAAIAAAPPTLESQSPGSPTAV